MHTFFVPQDHASLITTLGGPTSFTDHLSYLHTSGLLYIGDEQAFLPVFQSHYAGPPGLSAYFSHFYIPSQFNTTLAGIAGNDDFGAMGSFTTLSMMGLWPVPGPNVLYILSHHRISHLFLSLINRQEKRRRLGMRILIQGMRIFIFRARR